MNETGTGMTARAKKRMREKKLKTALTIVAMLVLWAGLVGGGYYYALRHLQETEQFISGRIDELALENQRIEEEIAGAINIIHQELDSCREEMQQVQREMVQIQEELELTGESITGTDQTRQSLQERISELDKQLAALREQLRKLEEATRAF